MDAMWRLISSPATPTDARATALLPFESVAVTMNYSVRPTLRVALAGVTAVELSTTRLSADR